MTFEGIKCYSVHLNEYSNSNVMIDYYELNIVEISWISWSSPAPTHKMYQLYH